MKTSIIIVTILLLGCERRDRRLGPGDAGPRGSALPEHAAVWRDGCLGGSVESCGRIARALYFGIDGVTASPREAVGYMFRGCALGATGVCSMLGVAYASGRGVPFNPQRARAYFEWGCLLRNVSACGELAEDLYFGTLGAPDVERASQLASMVCEYHQNPQACALAGAIGLEADGGADFTVAAEQLGVACQEGDAWACARLAHAHRTGQLPRDDARSLELDLQACEARSDLCVFAATAYLRGEGTPRDDVKGRDLMTRACEAGSTTGCAKLGSLLYKVGEYTDAYRRFASACADGHMGACNNQGHMLANAEGVATDYQLARTLYERACQSGVVIGCQGLGFIYQQGLGVPAQPAEAALHYATACDGGRQDACAMLRALRDPAHAKEHLQQACKLGATSACSLLP